MSAVWRIDIEDHSGDVVTTLKNFQYFSFETRIARRGSFRLQLHDDDPNASLIQDDYIARLWLKDLRYGIQWTNIFNGIIKTPSRVWYSNGNKLSIFYGSDSNELFDKALVLYPTSSAEAGKSTAAGTAMYEYLDENIGTNATIANGRDIDHVMPVTITTVGSMGTTWTGNMANSNLTKALQDIRNFTIDQNDRIDFHSYYLGNYQWEVQVGKIFEDKTINGLDPSTGLNGAGNVPIVLSPLYENVKQYTESTPRVQESNVVLVLGQRTGEDRERTLAFDPTSIATSPIAQRESLAQTQNQENLTDVALTELRDRTGKLGVLIEPKFTDSFALFRDLNPGDFFTVVSLDGVAFTKQFIELKTVVQQTSGGRTIAQYTCFLEDGEF